MSKSTSGAYGDFPDYYYESGNQFGAFLLGKTVGRSWDTRMEATLVPGGGPIVHGPGGPRGVVRRPATKPELSAHDELMIYVRGMLSTKAAANVLNALAAARGVVDVPTARDPYEALDRFALRNLSEVELRMVLQRMRELARKPPSRKTKPRRARNFKM